MQNKENPLPYMLIRLIFDLILTRKTRCTLLKTSYRSVQLYIKRQGGAELYKQGHVEKYLSLANPPPLSDTMPLSKEKND